MMTPFFKKYIELSLEEVNQIERLIISGGEIDGNNLPRRLANSKTIGYFKDKDKIIATATIKSPNPEYVKRIFEKSEVKINCDDYQLEMGYVMVDENYRGKKLASKLCDDLSNLYNKDKIFSTTKVSNEFMRKILLHNGFNEIGTKYLNNDKTDYLKLFIK